jgi:hypothetical protein
VNIRGGNISSSENTTVSIIEEQVRIILLKERCLVTCKFWVSSESRDEHLNVAFPNSLTDFDLFHDRVKNGIKDFRVSVDNKSVKFSKEMQSTLSFGRFKDNVWFTFGADIKRGKVHTIECSYVDTWYGTYNYLIGTGITWNGPMRKGRIVFDHSKVCSKLFVQKPSTYKENNDPELPIRLNAESFGDSIVYSYENYKPDSNETVGVKCFNYWNSYSFGNPLDTVPLSCDVLKYLSYNSRNSFLFEYLSDTARYPHKYDFAAIRREVFSKSTNAKSKRTRTELPSQERVVRELLSGNLDSLRMVLDSISKMTAQLIVDTIIVKDSCGNRLDEEAVAKEMMEHLEIPPEDMKMILNVARRNLEGRFEVFCATTQPPYIDTVAVTGNGNAAIEYIYPMLTDLLGFVRGRSLINGGECKKYIDLKARFRVE